MAEARRRKRRARAETASAPPREAGALAEPAPGAPREPGVAPTAPPGPGAVAAADAPPEPGGPREPGAAGAPAAPREPGAVVAPAENLPRRERNQLRDEAARAALAPLGPDERPWPLVAAVAVCVVLGAANAIAYAAGAHIASKHPGAAVLAFTGVMAILAGGMWMRRYLALLAFEALLALIVLFFSLFLVEASNVEAVILCVAVIATGGWLFWKLIRVMGRMSVPRQSSRAGG